MKSDDEASVGLEALVGLEGLEDMEPSMEPSSEPSPHKECASPGPRGLTVGETHRWSVGSEMSNISEVAELPPSPYASHQLFGESGLLRPRSDEELSAMEEEVNEEERVNEEEEKVNEEEIHRSSTDMKSPSSVQSAPSSSGITSGVSHGSGPHRVRQPRRASFGRYSSNSNTNSNTNSNSNSSSAIKTESMGSIPENPKSAHQRAPTWGSMQRRASPGMNSVASSQGSATAARRTTATSRRTSPSLSGASHRTSAMGASAQARRMSPSQDSVNTQSTASGALKQIRQQGRNVLSTIIPGRNRGQFKDDNPETYEDFVQDQDAALGTIGSAQATDWESMAAAAAIVSGGVTATDARNQRRFNVGDRVLVVANVNKRTPADDSDLEGGALNQSSTNADSDRYGDAVAAPVNKLGFPQGKGDTEEERRGPYVYVLATVRKVHFEEDARYYTVTREDNACDQRADTVCMEPVSNPRAEAAALKAAQVKALPGTDGTSGATGSGRTRTGLTLWEKTNRSKLWRLCCVCAFCLDCIWLCTRSAFADCKTRILPKLADWRKWFVQALKRQSRLMLNGMKPYECHVHITMINFLVICSLIFMFGDMFLLAFLPHTFDFAAHVLFLVVWIVLVLELAFEVFIRPTGYQALTLSEKAYAPSTARFLNSFHLFSEILALLLFLPELWCLFDHTHNCSQAMAMNMLESSLKIVLGPTRLDCFSGLSMFAFTRLRIFGLVRHWKRMWINSSFTPSSISHKDTKFFRGFLVPQRHEEAEETLKEATTGDHEGSALLSQKNSNTSSKKKAKRDDVSTATTENMDDDDANSLDGFDATGSKTGPKPPSKEEDLRLKNAATIGTALLVINSHRAMLLLVSIVGLLPIINTIRIGGGSNNMTSNMVSLLQQNNVLAPNPSDCGYLENASLSWLRATALVQQDAPLNPNESVQSVLHLLWAQLLPVRCEAQGTQGIITSQYCVDILASGVAISKQNSQVCNTWIYSGPGTPQTFANKLNIREGSITTRLSSVTDLNNSEYSVQAMFDESRTVTSVNLASFLLQLSLLVLILIGLSVLRVDAGRLVLNPLRRMLKIVLRYAENPLAPAPRRTKKGGDGKSGDEPTDGIQDYFDSDSEADDDDEDQLGHYETEQLINAITKITDLLRKCWGVAGAGIISSNLARTEGGKTAVFNPCVPGRLVYALFGFVGINDFSQHLRNLDQDVMILINDVARVVHGEVYRWGYGGSGQCNKNLGSCFLMVFRIGDSQTVQKRKEMATEVIFSSMRKRSSTTKHRLKKIKPGSADGQNKAVSRRKKIAQRRRKMSELMSDNLQLASLPGISSFTDRAVIGFLKSYAGVYRDKHIQNWKDDFRLGAGVRAFSVDMIFGMDAGWAVEGAVGSEYKIDATYLSPHVNMASRMMSASKQYGVSLLVSQAVEELLSDNARSKFRHLDTVTVKGSSVRQRIFTYDMRHSGVDFFLFDRSDKDANLDAECYSPSIWDSDQDLIRMRQHISKDFLTEFNFGRDQYLAGNWKSALQHLKKADSIMVTHVVDEGYLEESIEGIDHLLVNGDETNADVVRLRAEISDGPSRSIIAYMEKRGGTAPQGWAGYRPLTSK